MGTGDDPERQPGGSSRRLSSPAQLELAEHGGHVAGSFRRRRSTQARAGWRSSPRSEGLLSARHGARCLHISPRSDLESCMSGSLITGRGREAERDRCRSSTSPPDQSAGTRPQGPARRPSGRSFRRGIEDATVRALVNGAQPSDPSGGYRKPPTPQNAHSGSRAAAAWQIRPQIPLVHPPGAQEGARRRPE